MQVISGSSNITLSENIAKELGSELIDIEISKFACSDTRIRITQDIKDQEVLLVQSTSHPTNETIMELALIADATKRLKPNKITALIPWFGYSPQDKIFRKGEPLSAELAIKILEISGIDEFYVVDIHSDLVVEMFNKPVSNLSMDDLFIDHVNQDIFGKKDWVVASLDKGDRKRAQRFAEKLNLDVVVFEKTRDLETGIVTFHNLIGNVDKKHVITFDDYVSTGGTLIQSAEFLKNKGALSYTCCVTHAPVFKVFKKVEKSKIDKLIISNSIDNTNLEQYKKVEVLDIAKRLAELIC